MNDQVNQNSDSDLGAGVNAASNEAGAIDPASLTLAELSQALGKDFKDKESALKSLKDTNSYVGKRVEDIAATVRQELEGKLSTQQQNVQNGQRDPVLEGEIRELKETVFFSQNPQYKDYADVIKAMGGNPAEVVEKAEFKKVYEMGQKAVEADSKKSVVSSNSRIASPPSVMQAAVAVANNPGSGPSEVAAVFAAEIAKQMREA